MERFSKRSVAIELYRQFIALAKKHNFTTRTGTAQVVGHPTPTIVAYGQWDQCRYFLNAFDLWELVPDSEMPKERIGNHNGDPIHIKD